MGLLSGPAAAEEAAPPSSGRNSSPALLRPAGGDEEQLPTACVDEVQQAASWQLVDATTSLGSPHSSECDCPGVVGDEGGVAQGLLRRRREEPRAEAAGAARPRRPKGTSVNALQRLADVDDGYHRREALPEDAGLREHIARRRRQLALQLFRRVGVGSRRPAWRVEWVPPALAKQRGGGALVCLPAADGWGGASGSSCGPAGTPAGRRFAPRGAGASGGAGAAPACLLDAAPRASGRGAAAGEAQLVLAHAASSEPARRISGADCADTELDSTLGAERSQETQLDSTARAELLEMSQVVRSGSPAPETRDLSSSQGTVKQTSRKRELLSPLGSARLLKRKRSGPEGEADNEEQLSQEPVRRNCLQGLPSPELLQLAEQIERRFL